MSEHRTDLSSRTLLFVGSYNTPVPHAPQAHGRGIEILELDFDAKEAGSRLVDKEVEQPSYIYFDARRHTLYAVSELWGGGEGTVSALSLDEACSKVTKRTTLGTGGTVPCYASLLEDRYLLVANYGDGSLATFALAQDGQLESRTSVLRFSGRGPNAERQGGPHAHCILPHTNGLVYATDLGTDNVYRYWANLGDGSLDLVGQTNLPPGSGPRHMRFLSSGNLAVLVLELSSHLAVFEVAGTGELVQQAYLSLLPPDFQGESFGADVVVSNDGRHVYATNRGHDSVVTFQVDPATGKTAQVGWQPCGGKTPRSLALDPSGHRLVVANQDSDNIKVFNVGETGKIEPAFSIPVPTPVCVKFTA